MFSSKDLFFTPTSGFTVSKSLRFRSSASAYLNRTFGTPTNQAKWTWSAWVKLGSNQASNPRLFSGGTATTDTGMFDIAIRNDALTLAGNTTLFRISNAVFRDFSAFYHIIVSVDTTQGTEANKLLAWVNGVSISWGTTNAITTCGLNANTASVALGRIYSASSNYFDGYLAEVNFIDGQALTPSSFGAYDTNGVWQPARYTGSYGNNGFYLPFTNTTSTTTLVADSSGNGNNWTPNNISLTAGVTYDSMLDSPTNATGDIGNYAVLNPIGNPNGPITTYSSGNLDWANAGSAGNAPKMTVISTIGLTTGKWYFEQTPGSNVNQKIGFSNAITVGSARGTSYFTYVNDGTTEKSTGITFSGTPATYTTNNVIGVAIDIDAGTATFYKNNASQATVSGIPAGTWFAYAEANASASASGGSFNFGQRPFAYTPPSGFSALNTQNLPTPTITNGAQYMAAVTYQGATAPNTVTTTSSNSGNNPNGVSFQPDLVWIKSRSAATDNKVTDALRGVTKAWITNSSNAPTTDTNGLTAFTASGFTVGSDTTYNNTTGPATYIAWQWLAGNVASPGNLNTNGSLNSYVSVNASAGFSIVSATAGASGISTVGHGLGVAPNFLIVKPVGATASSTQVFVSGVTSINQFLVLTDTRALATSANIWGSSLPDSNVFGFTNGNTVVASQAFIAYCFAPVAGYSAFGSYAGNSSTDGPFVYTGFRPRYVMIKAITTGSIESWELWDTSRSPYNVVSLQLFANTSAAESDGSARPCILDILSNGFKIRGTNSEMNSSSYSYAYACFAENPFKISRAR